MHRIWIACLTALLCLAAVPARAITIEQAMADPDWIGPPVERAYWSLDGGSVYYQVKQKGSPVRDLHRVDLANGRDSVVDPKAMAEADAATPVYDRERKRAAFVRNGDVFVRELSSGRLLQITRTPQNETSPQFSADGRAVQYRVGNDWFVHDLASHVSGPAAVVKTAKNPDAKKPDDLGAMQLRWFSTLRKIKSDRDAQKKHADDYAQGDPTRAPLPFFIGDEVQVEGSSLSPDGRWLLLVTSPKGHEAGREGKLQRFVTESGYEEQEDERTRVGRNVPAPQSLLLLDLARHTQRALAFDTLPGIDDDPLKAVREENEKLKRERGTDAESDDTGDDSSDEKEKKKDRKDEPESRPVRIVSDAEDGGGGGIAWSTDGQSLAIQIRAIDNKDRWIATVDFDRAKLVNQHRLTDPAWINWTFNEFGWARDNRTLWYVSEESGYSQLYAKTMGGMAKALTRGTFEISAPVESPDGQWFYLRANVEAPYSYDVYRVASGGGDLQRVTSLKGLQGFTLSPDGRQLALLHSSAYVPNQLAVAGVDGGTPRELTDTRTAEFKAQAWLMPEIVQVPSTHTKQPIHAKFYKPRDFDPSKKYPAVLFVHGAGYLQNVHLGYPAYFREQMFHNLLVEKGYVVLDMDYRASEGYGRDWRTAIYRRMGTPELEDLIDGVRWLEKNASADPARVGLYGGSYGGFMALMAMFRAPDVFQAGAALRPVTDWTQYNHEYTSNILNTPQLDPIAYERSSPIEFADGLEGGLLIAHGMIDDNVLYEDSVRLFQRLVELRKDDFELAGYPLERHGFVHADAWLDEYKRILKLFETHLK